MSVKRWGCDSSRRANELELLAQAVYDMRDATPSVDEKTWRELDRMAGKLSKIGARCRKS